MPQIKYYRVKKEFILEVDNTERDTLFKAFKAGYPFIKTGSYYYELNTIKTHRTLTMQLVEIEIVEGEKCQEK